MVDEAEAARELGHEQVLHLPLEALLAALLGVRTHGEGERARARRAETLLHDGLEQGRLLCDEVAEARLLVLQRRDLTGAATHPCGSGRRVRA